MWFIIRILFIYFSSYFFIFFWKWSFRIVIIYPLTPDHFLGRKSTKRNGRYFWRCNSKFFPQYTLWTSGLAVRCSAAQLAGFGHRKTDWYARWSKVPGNFRTVLSPLNNWIPMFYRYVATQIHRTFLQIGLSASFGLFPDHPERSTCRSEWSIRQSYKKKSFP